MGAGKKQAWEGEQRPGEEGECLHARELGQHPPDSWELLSTEELDQNCICA